MNGQNANKVDSARVIIIGGGPVGLGLAMNLDALGVKCVLVNREPASRHHPKGNTHNARTMEHYRRLGISRKIRTLGLPADYPTHVGYFTRLNGWELARLSMASEAEQARALRNPAATDQVPEPLFRSNQMYVEAFLLDHVRTLANVELRYGWQCVGWQEDADGVSVEIEETGGGRRETLRGAYLAGCDGGQSFVRRKLGIRYGGEGTLEQEFLGGAMVSTYLRSPEIHGRVIKKLCWHYWTVNPVARTLLISLDGKDDFLLMTKLPPHQDKPDDATIARIFQTSVGENVSFEFLGHWPWTAGQALVADSFGAGRVWLAGDAVHLFTPTGGFGMNTGIDDAANLGWKLAAAIQGWGGPKLVPSYQQERHPIAGRNTAASRRLARNVGDVPVGAAIEENSAAGEEARRRAGDFLANFGEEFASLGVQLGARYDGSPLIADDSGAAPPDDPAVYVPSSRPGGRAPHLWLSDGSSLFDRLGRGFSLLRFDGSSVATAPIEEAARARRVPLQIVDVRVPAAGRDLYGADLALIRPDQHVAWRGNRLPADCDGLLAQVTGW
jgi:2-polyprenyl-6-methoxyphenol hydroxylase-like FAD-dependent oxidoreductase